MQPKLRFKGFNDEWENKLLKDNVEFYSGLTYSPSDIAKDGILVIRSSNIINNNLVTTSDNSVYVNPNAVNSEYVRLGDIIVVVRNGSRNLIGKHALTKKKINNTVIGAFMTGIRTINYQFINSLLDTIQFKKAIYINLGATINQITIGNFKNMHFMFPSNNEQQKIGALFAKLDNLIDLQAKKLELLKQLKQGLLQKLFPQNNQTTPQLRFKGFNDALKCTELDELTVKIGDGLHGTPQYDENGTLFFINGNNLKNGKIVIFDNTKKVTEQKLNYKLNNNTILMSINGTIGNLAYYNNEFVMLGKSVCYLEINPMHLNKSFLYGLLQTHKIYKEFSLNLTGTTIKNLGLATIKKLKVKYPNLPEQQKIGSLLANLDKLLTKTQEKITLFKQVKKYLLQQMFI